MKSNTIVISNSEKSTTDALFLIENFYSDVSPKALLRLRLLAEETMNLVRSITGETDMTAEFWAEKEGNLCSLHLNTNTVMYAQKRKELMEISTSKTNAAARGFLGKIREVFELALLPKDERTARESRIGMMGLADPTSYMASPNETWKMSAYINNVNDTQEDTEFVQEARNELERSILGNIARDVTIGIVGDDVSMVIEYECE